MKISDKYINMSGFLEGGVGSSFKWSRVEIIRELTEKEWESIFFYKFRAREFLLNIEDLRLPSYRKMSSSTGGSKATISSNVYPGRHRAKSIYLDFRHFLNKDEPSNFYKVLKILTRKIENKHLLGVFLGKLKSEFIKEKFHHIEFNGETLRIETLINIWFNTEYFHAGKKIQRVERELILNVVENESVQELLFWEITRCQHEIQCLYAVLKDLNEGIKPYLNCPPIEIIGDSIANKTP